MNESTEEKIDWMIHCLNEVKTNLNKTNPHVKACIDMIVHSLYDRFKEFEDIFTNKE